MTAKGPLALAAWLLLLGALATLFVPACSENGQTGNCPDLSLYEGFNAVYRSYFGGEFPARGGKGRAVVIGAVACLRQRRDHQQQRRADR